MLRDSAEGCINSDAWGIFVEPLFRLTEVKYELDDVREDWGESGISDV